MSSSDSSSGSDFVSKGILLLIVAGILTAGGIWLWKNVFFAPKSATVVDRFEGIKRIQELRLVHHHYEEIIPIFKNPQKQTGLEFLVMAPADVYGKIDMSLVRYEVGRDSLIRIVMPEPALSDVQIDLNNTTEYAVKGSVLTVYFGGGEKKFQDAFLSIRGALTEAKAEVISSAIKNKIMEQTARKGREYLQNTVMSMGYRVEFIQREELDTAREGQGPNVLNNLKDLIDKN